MSDDRKDQDGPPPPSEGAGPGVPEPKAPDSGAEAPRAAGTPSSVPGGPSSATPPAAGPRPPDQPGVAAAREAKSGQGEGTVPAQTRSQADPSAPSGAGGPGADAASGGAGAGDAPKPVRAPAGEGAPPRPVRDPVAGASGTPAAGGAAAAGAAGEAPAPRPVRAPAGPSPAELAQRAEVPSTPLSRLRDRFPEIAKTAAFFVGVPIVEVPVASIVEVCRFLKEDAQADCKYLSNLHGTHNPDRPKPLEVVYHLYSITTSQWIELKVEVMEGEDVPTVSTIWKTANWHEREAYDLLGIRFSGHPGLTRILLPDDWVGHPLRKEYPLEGKEGDHKLYR